MKKIIKKTVTKAKDGIITRFKNKKSTTPANAPGSPKEPELLETPLFKTKSKPKSYMENPYSIKNRPSNTLKKGGTVKKTIIKSKKK